MKDYLVILYEMDYNANELKKIRSYFGLGTNLALHIGKEEIALLQKKGNKIKSFSSIEDAVAEYDSIMGSSPKTLLCHTDKFKDLPHELKKEDFIYCLTPERSNILFGNKEDKDLKKANEFLRG